MYLGIDLGTGSVKVMRVGGDGQTQVASASYPIEAPQSGFSETDPAQWIRAIRQAVAELSARSDAPSCGLISAVGTIWNRSRRSEVNTKRGCSMHPPPA